MARIYIGVGSNELPGKYIPNALAALDLLCTEIVCSPIYLSEGVDGAVGQFVNLVVGANTALAVNELNIELKAIEQASDRQAGYQSLDLDLLLYDDLVLKSDVLTLPRDDITRYIFVLKPLAELAPALVHPVTGVTIEQMLRQSEMDESVLTEVSLEALEPR